MNYLELNPWITSFVWTLLHSVWQTALIAFLYLGVTRAFRMTAPFRYVLSAGSLALSIVASLATFIFLFTQADQIAASPVTFEWTRATTPAPADLLPAAAISLPMWIDQHLDSIAAAWTLGSLFFTLRLIVSWWQTLTLRRNLLPVNGVWNDRLAQLCAGMGIRRKVQLAESSSSDSPVVLGWLRPLILLPVGMLSGLTPDQVETILLHELAHIRRHDYLVNIFQSIVEVIFFFNPFVWMISGHVRREREQCCDDIVVALRNPMVYARALQRLEESRVTSLVLAANRKQSELLQRIKRIMETKMNKERSSGKIISAACVLVGLVLGSWLSVQAYRPERKNYLPDVQIVDTDSIKIDTVKRPSVTKKSATYSRSTVTTYDEQGNPHEEITEKIEGDEDLRKAITVGVDPVVAGGAPWQVLTDSPDFFVINDEPVAFPSIDTIPDHGFNRPDWEEFSKNFTRQFQEHFKDFYQKNRPEFDKMMKDFNERFAHADWDQKVRSFDFDSRLQDQFRELQLLNIPDGKRQAEMLQEKARQLERQAREWPKSDDIVSRMQADQFREMAENMKNLRDLNFRELEQQSRRMEARSKAFEKELTEQLVQDGYLKAGETTDHVNWTDTGIEVNGKKIKQGDVKKYEMIRNKYFDKHATGRVE